MGVNGQQKEARFSFEVFRFVQDSNTTLSTFYLHCVSRLCERTVCISLRQNCTDNIRSIRKKREVQDTSVTNTATVSSGQIHIQLHSVGEQPSGNHTSVKWVVVAAGVIAALCISIAAFSAYRIIVPDQWAH
ncbi:zona pellucida-like domain-containing protein 1 [Esox lucius]|uniref:zona pellucida-like domain-containing protein 1 n=1 Tax=Esox lucius TaxID=8010 RepID=UPI0005779DD2|nr:zona pellucida-like domain-containing protein 1 [Esox lucius]XP_034149270.1 zona pellucida-like domain-containing protein 1 [Esox lucius]XP_034149271.1 zona pellucida-like domain-containing protein 1 [Esox lucius]